jgi:hypothetical protein
VRPSVRLVRPSVSFVRPSVTSDKGQRLVDLGQGKSGLTLSTVAATSLPRWMVGVAPGIYGWLRGAYVGGWAHTHVGGAHMLA